METVMSILHRMVGPLMLVVGLSVLYLLCDGIGLYIDAVEDNYADAYTYEQGKPASYEEPLISKDDLCAILAAGLDENDRILVVTEYGTNDGAFLLTWNSVAEDSTGWDVQMGQYRVAEEDIISTTPSDLKTVLTKVNGVHNFKKVKKEKSSVIGNGTTYYLKEN